MERRDFLKAAGLGLAGASLTACASSVSQPLGSMAVRPGQKPKNIIFMVSDGMSQGALSLAEVFCERHLGRRTRWGQLIEDPSAALGLMETYSLNALVTDSAAAASSWGSGSRVMNGAINEFPDGTKLTTIGELVKATGRGMGLVTTASVTHATPAGFAANQASRGDEADIIPQYLDRVDVIMGGGNRFIDPAQRRDGRDVYADFANAGYRVVRQRTEALNAGREGKVLGIFTDGYIPYTVDHMNSPVLRRDVPTLAEMTTIALNSLAQQPNGFLLQVEGARIDHAAHGNDAPGLIWDQVAFDDAVGVVLEWARERGDTLVIVTSDHGNSNPGLTYYDRSFEMFDRMPLATGSISTFIDRARAAGGDQPQPVDVRELVRLISGFEISAEDAKILADTLGGNAPMVINSDMRGLSGIWGQVMGNYNGVHWNCTSHTQDHTLVSATGPGQEHFAGLMKNTECFDILCKLFDIQHKNPVMTLEDAKRHIAAKETSQVYRHFEYMTV
jgi:alkaline phosphatase